MSGLQLSPAREESRQTLAEMLRLLGYPESFATELERRSYERGRVWGWVPETGA